MKSKVFVPSHITGFFKVHHNEDLSQMGSTGCGVALEEGMTTGIAINEANENQIRITLNGEVIEGQVSRRAIEIILGDLIENYNIRVDHVTRLPLSQGFGLSGAGALGVAVALNKALGLGLTGKECGMAAHRAEVENRTGLGDVIGQLEGGLVIRTKPGGPGIGETDNIFSDKFIMAFLLEGALETNMVLSDRKLVEKINHVGGRVLDNFMKNPSEENFMESSYDFATKTGLMGKKVQEGVESLREKGVISSMGMLGNSIFTLTDEPERVSGLLDFPCIISKIDKCGARLNGK